MLYFKKKIGDRREKETIDKYLTDFIEHCNLQKKENKRKKNEKFT